MERLRKDFIHSVLLSAMGICIVREGRQSIYIDAILCRGYRTLTRIPDVRVMVHVKVWEGLMESSWQFLIQVSFGYIPYVNPFFLPDRPFPVQNSYWTQDASWPVPPGLWRM